MSKPRIAVLFDAENTACTSAPLVFRHLEALGTVQSACAVGDFTILAPWIDCARTHGIDLVMQPSLGKGKNSADIRLSIEAMDLAHRGCIDALALVTSDRDFTPLAFRLRETGIAVHGFSQNEPSSAFRAACTSFNLLQQATPEMPALLSLTERQKLREIVSSICKNGDVDHVVLGQAVRAAAPELATRLKGKFLKTLIAHGLVQRIGSGPQQKLRRAG